ncbi:SRPBCC family protein [Saccharomonospora saliphila]|uniref:SRPBCC family protein n=1 Tax=Saccharomonospora saliphila TaxID=369829 RepID=UPI00036993AA|nr:SRPBCC domain-containing protein [Saccharomonospora saliphila]
MTTIQSTKDTDALTMTFVAEFDADAARVWRVWEDPRRLERWWGPPTYPATFERHEFEIGGHSRYYMTGPDGDKARGWWTITAVDAPHRLEFDDGFADEHGQPDSSMPTIHVRVTLEDTGAGTRMTMVTTFSNRDDLERLLDMGMEEGLRSSLEQIDDLLTAPTG